MNTRCSCEQELGRPLQQAVEGELDTMAGRLATFQRISWRDAFGLLAGAAFRIHHYRDVRTKMLHDALCDLDCHADCDP